MPDRLVRMLYIGNSFTTRNDMPAMVKEFAQHKGIDIQHEVISAGGASLRRHFNRGASDKIRAARWDYVVLQEQSTLPNKNRKRFHENVREFMPAVKDAGAKLVLYMTWARKNEPENQALLTDGYNEIGEELGATVVPAGIAWKLRLAEYSEPVLHDRDGSHPTFAGTYLAACTLFLTLFGDEPADLETDELTDDDQKLLQRFASAALKR